METITITMGMFYYSYLSRTKCNIFQLEGIAITTRADTTRALHSYLVNSSQMHAYLMLVVMRVGCPAR